MNRRHLLRAVSGMAGGVWLVPGAASGRQDQPATGARPEPLPVPDETKIRLLELPGRVDAAILSADGSLVVAGGGDGTVRFWDAVSGRALAVFRGHDFRIEAITLSPDRRRIAIRGPEWAGVIVGGISSVYQEMGGVIKVWDIAAERLLDSFPVGDAVQRMAFNTDGKRLVFVTDTGLTIRNIEPTPDDTWRMRELAREKDEATPWRCGGGVFSHDAHRAVTICSRRGPKGSYELALRLWDVPPQRIRTLEHLQDQIGQSFDFQRIAGEPIALSGDGKLIAISSVGVPLADDRDISDKDRPPRVDEPLRYPATEPRERERLVTVLDFDGGKVVSQFRVRPGTISHLYDLAFSPDGSWIVSVIEDNAPTVRNQILRLWHARTGHELRAYRGPRGQVRGVAFLPDGRLRILSGGDSLTNEAKKTIGTDPLKVWEAALPVP